MRRIYASAIALALVAGAALVIASDAQALDVAGIVLLGIAVVIAVAAVFLEIGLSEDREREGSDRGRRPPG